MTSSCCNVGTLRSTHHFERYRRGETSFTGQRRARIRSLFGLTPDQMPDAEVDAIDAVNLGKRPVMAPRRGKQSVRYRTLHTDGPCGHHHRTPEAATRCDGNDPEFVQVSRDGFLTWEWMDRPGASVLPRGRPP